MFTLSFQQSRMSNIKSTSDLLIGEHIVSKTTKRTMKIGDFCRKEIMKNKSAKKIIEKANKLPNGGNVNAKHIAWYCWDMRNPASNNYVEEMPSRYSK